MKAVLHLLQAAVAILVLQVMRYIPMRWSAAFGGWLFRLIGPRLKADGIARRNLAKAFPDMAPDETERIVRGMWDNLGRGAGEWSRLDLIDTKDPKQVDVVGEDILINAAKAGPCVIVTAHLANWEVGTLVAHQRGVDLASIYKPPSNPWMDRYVRYRRAGFNATLIPKSRESVRRLYEAVREGKGIGLMVDQKLNEGIPIPFFGREAMTGTMPADIALRWRCPILPVRYERLPNSRMRVTIHPPLELPDSGDKTADRRAVMMQITGIVEGWIRERPEEWFWVHRRWPDEKKEKPGR